MNAHKYKKALIQFIYKFNFLHVHPWGIEYGSIPDSKKNNHELIVYVSEGYKYKNM